MFFRQMTEAFLVRTEPASSMVKPAHIHITSAPQMRNEKLLRMNCVSAVTAAYACGTMKTSETVNMRTRPMVRQRDLPATLKGARPRREKPGSVSRVALQLCRIVESLFSVIAFSEP